jgi:hypothetical protein
MPQSAARTTEVVIRSHLAQLANLRDSLETVGAELGVPHKSLMELHVALDEIASMAFIQLARLRQP